jgi:outer membrane biosynthesis protein TonB
MKNSILTAAATLALAACSTEQPSNNVFVNEAEPMVNVLDAANNTATAPEVAAPAAAPPAVAPDETRPKNAKAPAAAPRPTPPARPRPKAEAVDPHAGHDMANMAH